MLRDFSQDMITKPVSLNCKGIVIFGRVIALLTYDCFDVKHNAAANTRGIDPAAIRAKPVGNTC
jgi:hypothetical protein